MCVRAGGFELVVLGKNGVTVTSGMRGVLHTPASPPTELRSQDMIQMGDKTFYFLLPNDASRCVCLCVHSRSSPVHVGRCCDGGVVVE